MGASGWSYYVPFQEDVEAALQQLRDKVFAERDYYWINGEGDVLSRREQRRPWPATMRELYDDEDTAECGTHSILDMFRMTRPGEDQGPCQVKLLTAEEATRLAGTERLTREHVEAIDSAADQRWFGRAAVLHDAEDRPAEIYFWGFSGD
jgi:hypothetical protein